MSGNRVTWTSGSIRYTARLVRRRSWVRRLWLTLRSLAPYRGVVDDIYGWTWCPQIADTHDIEIGDPVYPGEPGFEEAPFEMGFLRGPATALRLVPDSTNKSTERSKIILDTGPAV